MHHRCCIPMCGTLGGHKFPKDPHRKAKWLKAIGNDNFVPKGSSRVCKKHFLPEDFVDGPTFKMRLYLKKSAVPSLFLRTSNPSLDMKNEELSHHRERQNICKEKSTFARRSSSRVIKKDMKAMEEGEVTQESKTSHNIETLKTGNVSEKPEQIELTVEAIGETLEADQKEESHQSKNNEESQKENNVTTEECRACLKRLTVDRLCSLFEGWAPKWSGMGVTIAEDLTYLSDVQLSETDLHSKFICFTCCEKLWNACRFKTLVRNNDSVLRLRIPEEGAKEWPKPIQVDKSINSFECDMPFNVDIKQEVLSDDEINTEEGYADANLMEIKVEPEEIIEQSPIIVNGVMSLKEFPNGEIATQLRNGEAMPAELMLQVKEEPTSDAEETGLPLECMLCLKQLHSVTGLKAHVIAQHSYQTVGRGAGDKSFGTQGDKHVCATCRRTFTTSTDLMVHETCHNKHVCYGCSAKFDTFSKLSLHRKRCKALHTAEVKRHKTLDDVMRPHIEDSQREFDNPASDVKEETKAFSCPLCNEIFTDSYYVKIHQEIHHSKETDSRVASDASPMEIEMLESIFNEET